jgi:hypothetical protein
MPRLSEHALDHARRFSVPMQSLQEALTTFAFSSLCAHSNAQHQDANENYREER